VTVTVDDSRLRVLHSTELLDSLPEPSFDRLTRLASHVMGAPVALVSLVDEHRQFFKSALGLDEPWASKREMPLSHSFCKHVARTREALVVSDAREDPRVRDNLAVSELGVRAYAGFPLMVEGEAIGAFCVVDHQPRTWPPDKLQHLGDLALAVVTEIELRRALETAQTQRALNEAIVESLGDACLAIDPQRRFLIANRAARAIFADFDIGSRLPTDWAVQHRSRLPDGSALPSEDGALGRALRGEQTNNLVFTLQRPGAEQPVWVEACGRPVRAADGSVVAAVSIYRDVTETKGRTDLYTALAGHIPQAAVALYDGDLRCLTVDGALPRASDRPLSSMVGHTLRELAGFAPQDPAFDNVEELLRGALMGQPATSDLVLGQRVLALHVAPVRDASGNIVRGIVLALDVTKERQLASALQQSGQIYRAIVQHLPRCAVMMVDRDLRYVSAEGPLLPEILQKRELDTLVGSLVADVVSPANREPILEAYRSALRGERQRRDMELEGSFYEVSTVPIYEGSSVSNVLVFSVDVTERRREAEELRRGRDRQARERALLEAVVAHIQDGVALLDGDRRVLLANDAFGAMIGLSKDEVEGMPRDRFLERMLSLVDDPEAFQAEFIDRTRPPARSEFSLRRPVRRIVRRNWTPVKMADGEGFLVTWQDVTAAHDLQRERERLLLVDTLTGIPNRRAAEETLRREHERMKRSETPMALAIFDIDHFKKVNDQFGHAAGDAVLILVARALAQEARVIDLVARWGGEEFLAVLNVPLDGARVFCERARQAVERLQVPLVERITVSAGAAEVLPGEAVSDVLARADRRLYEAKQAGRNRVHPE
jgi:diguanylate cyclase (GGDEF)-like protein/PAS domain S-box-containing protein